jgi:DNA-binding response OmpR family regulator
MTKRILTIDDDALFQEIVAATFTHAGYNVEDARNGEQGLALMRRLRPDIVLLDVRMPGSDGFHVLEQMKGDAALCAVPTVMLTGMRTERDVRRALALGVVDYLVKPVSPRALLERVERILDGAVDKPDEVWLL